MEDECWKYERLTVGVLKQLIKGLDDNTEIRICGTCLKYQFVPIIEDYFDKDNNVLELYI